MVDGTVLIRLCAALSVDTPHGTLTGSALGSRKARTLVALLAAERGRQVSVDRIVEALWPAGPPVDPSANVATLVSRLRKTVGADLIAGGGGTYGLTTRGPWEIDLDRVAASCAEAATRLAAVEPLLAAASARAALDLLGSGDALADQPDVAWVEGVRREAAERRRRAEHILTAALVDLDPAEAVRVAASAQARDPFDEQAVRDLMRALVAAGRVASALAAYDALASLLRDELGTAPVDATRALHLAILREVEVPTVEAPQGRHRRRTLVGREDELDVLAQAWSGIGDGDGRRLLVLVGEAGIGKSRLLDALSDLAAASGGRVLRARCHSSERSLFLQPYLDAIRPLLLSAPAARVTSLTRDHAATWRSLLPELTPIMPGDLLPLAEVELSDDERSTPWPTCCAGSRSMVRCSWSSMTSRTVGQRLSISSGTWPPTPLTAPCCWSAPCAPRVPTRSNAWAIEPYAAPEPVVALVGRCPRCGRWSRRPRWSRHGPHRRARVERGGVPAGTCGRRRRRPRHSR